MVTVKWLRGAGAVTVDGLVVPPPNCYAWYTVDGGASAGAVAGAGGAAQWSVVSGWSLWLSAVHHVRPSTPTQEIK